jgi:hypothetical protein
MKKTILFTLLLLALFAPESSQSASPRKSSWEQSLVTIEIARKSYDYFQPWTLRTETVRKNGVVTGPRQILTTAEYLNDRTLIRVQKNGRGQWHEGSVEWIDYHANLALVTLPDAKFWEGLTAVRWVDPAPLSGQVRIARWRNGSLDLRKGEIVRMIVKSGKLSWVEHLQMEINSDINGAGWSEAVVLDSKLAGLAESQDGNTCSIIPSTFIRPFLDARKKSKTPKLGFFDFVWQKASNPETVKYLSGPTNSQGVIVSDQIIRPGVTNYLMPRDVILEVEGFKIDSEGDYEDPDYGHLSLENLATRGKWAGDGMRMKIMRNRRMEEIRFPLPSADQAVDLVPENLFDREPPYMILGGMVLQPLTEPFLRSWGQDWQRKAPFRLAYYAKENPTTDRPSLVVMSLVLPDPFNIGYQDYRFLVVDRVNGVKINQLGDIADALKQAKDDYHVIDFSLGDNLHRIVLQARDADAATQRVMQRYGIKKESVMP